LSSGQLAAALGESEIAIEMIEKGKLPEDPENLIKKLEQMFQRRFRKVSDVDMIRDEDVEPVLLGEDGKELEVIPEEEMEVYEVGGEVVEDDEEEVRPGEVEEGDIRDRGERIGEIGRETQDYQDGDGYEEVGIGEDREIVVGNKKDERINPIPIIEKNGEEVFEVKRADVSRISIGDLKKVHKKKVEVTKMEQIEEQKKIEERRRILEALRERDRLKMEERRRDEAEELRRVDAVKKGIIDDRREEVRLKDVQDSKDIDKYLGGMELLEDEEEYEGRGDE